MNRRQIIPLDGSEAAEAALAFAEAISSDRVLLMICLPDADDLPSLITQAMSDEQRDTLRENAESYLLRMAAGLQRQGRSIERLVTTGDPAHQIVSNATSDDLIIMTTHGRGAGRRAIFGSVADRVVRHAPAPVLVVRGGERPIASTPIARIVVALDGSELAERALPIATELAIDLGAPVHLVRVLDLRGLEEAGHAGAYAAARYAASVDEIHEALANYLKEQSETLIARGLRVSTEVVDGAPGEVLIDLAQPSDVIVITSHGRSAVARWMLGSVAEKLVRMAPAPVLVCR